MGVAFGQFKPIDTYRTIQKQCIENHSDQSGLRLTVKTPHNETIQCAGVGILDYSLEAEEECIQLNVLGISYPLYEDLFPQHVARSEIDPDLFSHDGDPVKLASSESLAQDF